MERYENSFLWLRDAGVALPCYNVSEPVVPLKINEKHNLFKLFMADTGLLCAASLENVQFEILKGNLDVNMGSIMENVFAQILTANGFQLRYFDKKGKCELDFVIQKGNEICPLEILLMLICLDYRFREIKNKDCLLVCQQPESCKIR